MTSYVLKYIPDNLRRQLDNLSSEQYTLVNWWSPAGRWLLNIYEDQIPDRTLTAVSLMITGAGGRTKDPAVVSDYDVNTLYPDVIRMLPAYTNAGVMWIKRRGPSGTPDDVTGIHAHGKPTILELESDTVPEKTRDLSGEDFHPSPSRDDPEAIEIT